MKKAPISSNTKAKTNFNLADYDKTIVSGMTNKPPVKSANKATYDKALNLFLKEYRVAIFNASRSIIRSAKIFLLDELAYGTLHISLRNRFSPLTNKTIEKLGLEEQESITALKSYIAHGANITIWNTYWIIVWP